MAFKDVMHETLMFRTAAQCLGNLEPLEGVAETDIGFKKHLPRLF